jgi:hypothetical protein
MTRGLEFGYSGYKFGALLITRQFVITLIVLQNPELFPICVYSGTDEWRSNDHTV